MALLSITEARRYVKHTDISDQQLQEALKLLEEFVWTLYENA